MSSNTYCATLPLLARALKAVVHTPYAIYGVVIMRLLVKTGTPYNRCQLEVMSCNPLKPGQILARLVPCDINILSIYKRSTSVSLSVHTYQDSTYAGKRGALKTATNRLHFSELNTTLELILTRAGMGAV